LSDQGYIILLYLLHSINQTIGIFVFQLSGNKDSVLKNFC